MCSLLYLLIIFLTAFGFKMQVGHDITLRPNIDLHLSIVSFIENLLQMFHIQLARIASHGIKWVILF